MRYTRASTFRSQTLLLFLALACDDGAASSRQGSPDASLDGDGDAGPDASSVGGGSDGQVPDASTGGLSGGGGAAGSTSGGGSGGSEPDATSDGSVAALTFVSDADMPTGIALDETTVYWAEQGKNTIFSCPKTGCGASGPSVVATMLSPRGIALRGSTLYVIGAEDADTVRAQPVWKCTLGACAPEQMIDLELNQSFGPGNLALAVGDQDFYVVGGPSVLRCSTTGCGAGPDILPGPSGSGPILGVAVEAATAYLVKSFVGVHTCPLSGCSSEEPIVALNGMMAIALDGTNLYWSEYRFFNPAPNADGAIRTCSRSGCELAEAEVLAEGDIGPYAMAVDETSLYFTDYRNGRVERIAKHDSSSTCSADHFASCNTCQGVVRCDGTCSTTCDDAGAE
jgi:hypothetical protein